MIKGLGAISAFLVRSLLWLLPVLGLWYLLRAYAVLPATWLAGWVMEALFPYWVQGSELAGTTQTLLTHLQVRGAQGLRGELAPSVDVLVYAYGLPLLVTLLLASRATSLWWKLPAGYLALLPFQAWGVCFTWLMQVAVLAGAETSRQTYFGPFAVNLIGAGYQFGFLVLPTLVPVLLWLALDRRVMAAALIEGALGARVPTAPAATAAPAAPAAEPASTRASA